LHNRADRPGQPALARTSASPFAFPANLLNIAPKLGQRQARAGQHDRRFAVSTDFDRSVGRNFKRPKDGLGLDNNPSTHVRRTMLSSGRFL
jgi:hypothetical protein